jgi:hypothetical protein
MHVYVRSYVISEAAEFIQQRCEQLQTRADKLSEEASEVNSQIEVCVGGCFFACAHVCMLRLPRQIVFALTKTNLQVVLRGLQELMQISDPTPNAQQRTFL